MSAGCMYREGVFTLYIVQWILHMQDWGWYVVRHGWEFNLFSLGRFSMVTALLHVSLAQLCFESTP